MSKLLYIESSPRKTRSKSIVVANAFLQSYKATHPTDEIVTIDLWNRALPEFDGYTIDAKYQVLHGLAFDEAQRRAWHAVVDICDEFKAADKYLFSLPMWNFGIPYKLKHYLDLLLQPGQTFAYDPVEGYSGLVNGKPVAVVYARGGAYSDEQSMKLDHQKSYLELVLGFIGFNSIQSIVVEPTLGVPEQYAKAESKTIAHAEEVAAKF